MHRSFQGTGNIPQETFPHFISFLPSLPPSLPLSLSLSLSLSSYLLHPKLACCMDRMSCPLNCAGLLQRTVDWVRWDTIHCHSHWELQSHTSALSCVKSEPSFHWLQGQRVKCKGQCVNWLIPRTSLHSIIILLRCWGTCEGGLIAIGPSKPILVNEYPSTSVDLHVIPRTYILIHRLSQKAGWGLGISLFLVPRPYPLTTWWTEFIFLG